MTLKAKTEISLMTLERLKTPLRAKDVICPASMQNEVATGVKGGSGGVSFWRFSIKTSDYKQVLKCLS